MKRIFCMLLIVCFGASGPKAENESGSDTADVVVLKDSIVVTANRFGMNRDQSIWPVTTISRSELDNQTSLTESIDGKAGIDIRNYNGVGSLSTLSSWGLFNRHMLLLYNGRVVKDYSLGGFNLADFSVDEIDRIEILKGPQSAFYGADAVGGVVNLITKSAFIDEVEFGSKQGSFKYSNYHLNFSKRIKMFGISGYGEFTKSDNNRDNAGIERNLYNLSGSYMSPDNNHLINISTRYFKDSLGVPGPVPHKDTIRTFGNINSNSLYDHQKNDNYSFDVQYRYSDKSSEQFQFDFFWEKKNVDYYNRFQDFFSGDTVNSRSITNKRSMGMNGRFMKSYSVFTAASGIDWLSGSVKGTTVDTYFNNSPKSFNFWVGRQNQFDIWSNVITNFDIPINLDLSWRLQFIRNRKTQPSYNLGSLFNISDKLNLKLAYAYAFRLPSISEQYAVYPVEFYTLSNDKLNPETSKSLIITLSWKPAQRLEGTVTLFKQDVDSLIQYVPNISFMYVPENVEKLKTRGVEISSSVALNKYIFLNFSGTYQRAKQSYNSGDSLAQAKFIPEIKYRADMSGDYDKLNYNFSMSYTSNRNTNFVDWNLPTPKAFPKVIPKVYEFNLSLGYKLNDNLRSHLMIYDLTDEKRPDQFGFSISDNDYPSLGRRIILGFSYKL